MASAFAALAGANFLAQAQGASPSAVAGDDDDASAADDFIGLADYEEVEDLNLAGTSTAALNHRPRRLTIGQYRQFEVIEANRQTGEQVRQKEAMVRRFRDESMSEYKDMRIAKNAQMRGQQAVTDQAMRDSWTANTIRVSATKVELEVSRDKAMRQKQAWAANGARARALEVEQKRKIIVSRSKAEEARRDAVQRTKQQTSQQRATAQVALESDMEARKKLIDKLRRDNAPSGAVAEAREFIGKQKREAAAEVRTTVASLDLDRRRMKSQQIERASNLRAGALSSRRHAQNNRATVVVSRHQEAAALRESLKLLNVERKQMVVASLALNKQRGKALYESRFASESATAEVDASAYGSLVAATRMQGSTMLTHKELLTATRVASADPLRLGAASAPALGARTDAAPRERPRATETVVTAGGGDATASAVRGVPGMARHGRGSKDLFDRPGEEGGKGKRGPRYKPTLLTVKTVGWTGRGRDAPGTDMSIDIGGVTSVAELKERIRKRRPAWAELKDRDLRLLYRGHLAQDDAEVDETWTKSFVVAMEGRPGETAPAPSPSPSRRPLASAEAPSHELHDKLRRTLDAQYSRVIDLFRSWDADNSGTISAAELRRALHELGDATPAAQVDSLFATFDQTLDGLVEYDELHRALRARPT